MNWPWKRRKPVIVVKHVEIVVQNRWSGLTLEDWKRKREHIDWLRAQFADDRFRDMMSVLNNETPIPVAGEAFQAGVTRGHANCMKLICVMAEQPPEKADEPTVDYNAVVEPETEE